MLGKRKELGQLEKWKNWKIGPIGHDLSFIIIIFYETSASISYITNYKSCSENENLDNWQEWKKLEDLYN